MKPNDDLPPLPEPSNRMIIDSFKPLEPFYTADQMRAYARAAVAAERERCAALLTEYRVPVGNSAAGEMAAEMTMDALRELRDKIRKGGRNE